MKRDTNPPVKHPVPALLFLEFHAVASQNQRVLHLLEATVVLFLYSRLEPLRLLLGSRIETFVASLELTLPCLVLAFDSFPFASPIENQFRMDYPSQIQWSDTLTIMSPSSDHI